MVQFTINLSDSLAKFLLLVPTTLCSAGLEVLVSGGGMLVLGSIRMIPWNWKLRLLPGHFDIPVPLKKQGKKEVTVLARLIDTAYQGEIGLLLHNGGNEECTCSAGDPLVNLFLVLTMLCY